MDLRTLEAADPAQIARLACDLLARGLYINLAAKEWMSLALTNRSLDGNPDDLR